MPLRWDAPDGQSRSVFNSRPCEGRTFVQQLSNFVAGASTHAPCGANPCQIPLPRHLRRFISRSHWNGLPIHLRLRLSRLSRRSPRLGQPDSGKGTERLQARSERALESKDVPPPCCLRILHLRIPFTRLIQDGEHAAMLGYLPLHGEEPLLRDLLTRTPHGQVGGCSRFQQPEMGPSGGRCPK